jgi:hypothetical protein
MALFWAACPNSWSRSNSTQGYLNGNLAGDRKGDMSGLCRCDSHYGPGWDHSLRSPCAGGAAAMKRRRPSRSRSTEELTNRDLAAYIGATRELMFRSDNRS